MPAEQGRAGSTAAITGTKFSPTSTPRTNAMQGGTDRLGLDQSHVVVGRVEEVVLVERMMLRCHQQVSVRFGKYPLKERRLTSSTNQPDGTSRLREDTTTAEGGDLLRSSTVEVVVGEPDPGTLYVLSQQLPR